MRVPRAISIEYSLDLNYPLQLHTDSQKSSYFLSMTVPSPKPWSVSVVLLLAGSLWSVSWVCVCEWLVSQHSWSWLLLHRHQRLSERYWRRCHRSWKGRHWRSRWEHLLHHFPHLTDLTSLHHYNSVGFLLTGRSHRHCWMEPRTMVFQIQTMKCYKAGIEESVARNNWSHLVFPADAVLQSPYPV